MNDVTLVDFRHRTVFRRRPNPNRGDTVIVEAVRPHHARRVELGVAATVDGRAVWIPNPDTDPDLHASFRECVAAAPEHTGRLGTGPAGGIRATPAPAGTGAIGVILGKEGNRNGPRLLLTVPSISTEGAPGSTAGLQRIPSRPWGPKADRCPCRR